MTADETDVLSAVKELLASIYRQDAEYYRAHCREDLTAFEWFIAPGRIDGIDFHTHLIESGGDSHVARHARAELLTPSVQFCGAAGDVAIATFTLLVTFPAPPGGKPSFASENQTRVFEKRDGRWRMVHFHRSPTHP